METNAIARSAVEAYLQEKKDISGGARWAFIAGLVCSIVLAVLGIALLATGEIAAGIVTLALSIPMSYFFYNCYRLADNWRRVLSEPEKFFSEIPGEDLLNSAAGDRLSEGTFFFGCLVNSSIESFEKKVRLRAQGIVETDDFSVPLQNLNDGQASGMDDLSQFTHSLHLAELRENLS